MMMMKMTTLDNDDEDDDDDMLQHGASMTVLRTQVDKYEKIHDTMQGNRCKH